MGTDLAIVSSQAAAQRSSSLRNSLIRSGGEQAALRPVMAAAELFDETPYEYPATIMDYRCLELEPKILSARPGLAAYHEASRASTRNRKGAFISLYA